MPIIHVTKKQLEAANKARAAALNKDEDFRQYEERRQRFEEVAKALDIVLQKELKAPAGPKEEQLS